MIKTSEKLDAIAPALCQVQGAIDAVKKDAKAYGYNYTKLEDLIAEAKPHLLDAELAVVQVPTEGNEFVTVITRIVHSSGQWIEGDLTMPVVIPVNNKGEPTLNHAQAVGMVISYARRYAFASMLQIAQEDTDAGGTESGTHKQYHSGNCTEKQAVFIAKMMNEKAVPMAKVTELYGVERLGQLTKKQAGNLITELTNKSGAEIMGLGNDINSEVTKDLQ